MVAFTVVSLHTDDAGQNSNEKRSFSPALELPLCTDAGRCRAELVHGVIAGGFNMQKNSQPNCNVEVFSSEKILHAI